MSATPDVAARWKRRAVELASVPVSLSVETIDDLAAAIGINLRQSNIFIEIKDIDLVAKTVFAEAVEVALNAANSIDVVTSNDSNRGFVSAIGSTSFHVIDDAGVVNEVLATNFAPVMTLLTATAANAAAQSTPWQSYGPFVYDPAIPASVLYLHSGAWTVFTGSSLPLYVNGVAVSFATFGLSQIWVSAKFVSGGPAGWDFVGYKTGAPAVMPSIGTEMLNLGLAGWIEKPPANLTVNPVAPVYDPIINQPLGAKKYSIAYAPSIGGVITPTWQVWDLTTGFALANQVTMSVMGINRAPSMAEAIASPHYSRWYTNALIDLGRKS